MRGLFGLFVFLIFVATASVATAVPCCIGSSCVQKTHRECWAVGGYPVQDCKECGYKGLPPPTYLQQPPTYPQQPDDDDNEDSGG